MANTDLMKTPPVLGGDMSKGLPFARCGKAVTIRSSAILTANWVVSTAPNGGGTVIPVGEYRKLTLRCKYSAHASATANQYALRVMGAAELDSNGEVPDPTADDVWYHASVYDATGTATDLSGTKESGYAGTIGQAAGIVLAQPQVIKAPNPLAGGASEIELIKHTFDVSDDLFIYVAAQEIGETGNPGTLQIKANVSL